MLLLRCMQLLHAIFPPSMPSFLLLVSTVRYVLSTYVARPMQRNSSLAIFVSIRLSSIVPARAMHDVGLGQGSFLHHPSIGLWTQLHGEAREFDSPAAVPLHGTTAPVRPVSAPNLVVQCGRTEPRPRCRFQVHRRRRHCVVASRSEGGGQGSAKKRRPNLH